MTFPRLASRTNEASFTTGLGTGEVVWLRVACALLSVLLAIIGTSGPARATAHASDPGDVPLPATAKARDALNARLFGRWKVVSYKRLRGTPGFDDPRSWMGAEIIFGQQYFGDQACRCEGPVASATEMTVAAFFDTEYRDTLAVPGMALDEVVTVVEVECREGRHLPWKGGLQGACVATTPFEMMLLLKNGDVMVFGASWAYTLRRR